MADFGMWLTCKSYASIKIESYNLDMQNDLSLSL
jgi:hypothetical protein